MYSIVLANWDERLEEMDDALSDLERVLAAFEYKGPYNHPPLQRT
jgi:hypothetical protein